VKAEIIEWTILIMDVIIWRIADQVAMKCERKLQGKEIDSILHKEIRMKGNRALGST
jgi:hypothetical protein